MTVRRPRNTADLRDGRPGRPRYPPGLPRATVRPSDGEPAPGVDEVDRLEQRAVGEHLGRRPAADDPVLLAEDEGPVGDEVEHVEVVRGEHDRLAGPVELDEQ